MSSLMQRSVPGRWHWRAGTVALVAVCVLGSTAMVFGGQPAAAPPGPAGFVPISQLPPGEQLPAARLVIGAYAFVWVALLAYLWSIWRRLGTVERELETLSRRLPQKRS